MMAVEVADGAVAATPSMTAADSSDLDPTMFLQSSVDSENASVAAAADVDTLQQQQQFLAHRGVPSHSSDASSAGKTPCSSGHSATNHSGDAGALEGAVATLPDTSSSAPVKNDSSALNTPTPSAVEAKERDEEEEEDKENLLPIGDLSTSAEGAAAMMVESMEVVERQGTNTEGDCRR